MGSGFAKKKKQARMFQDQLSKLQTELKTAEATGSAGGGLVTITLNGEYGIKEIKIKPECVDPTDVEGLEDLIKVAHSEAIKKMQASAPTDLKMPGFPF